MDTHLSNDDVYFPGKISACFADGGGDVTVTYKHLAEVIEAVVDGFRAAAGRHKAEMDALKARIKSLEDRPPLKYCGVWVAGKTYLENSLVTKSGSLWIAKQTTAAYPGGGARPDSWQLCVKRGADGKDAAK